jgi:hypothetical protein
MTDANTLLYSNGPVVLNRLLASASKGPVARKNARKGFRLWAALLSSAVDREYPAPPRKKSKPRGKISLQAIVMRKRKMRLRGYREVGFVYHRECIETCLIAGIKTVRCVGEFWLPQWAICAWRDGATRLRELKHSRIKQQAELARAALEAQSGR